MEHILQSRCRCQVLILVLPEGICACKLCPSVIDTSRQCSGAASCAWQEWSHTAFFMLRLACMPVALVVI